MLSPCTAPQTAAPQLPLAGRQQAPRLMFDMPTAPGWHDQAARLGALLTGACQELERRGRRACRVTVTVRLADGLIRRRSLALARPTARPEGAIAQALGLLRLLVAEAESPVVGIALGLGALVESADQPIDFSRYLKRRRPQGLAGLLRRVGALLAG